MDIWQAKWYWSHSPSTDVVADVAYDFFTSTSPGGAPVNEMMIWLANFNSGPIAFDYDYLGAAQPVANSISLAGHKWYSDSLLMYLLQHLKCLAGHQAPVLRFKWREQSLLIPSIQWLFHHEVPRRSQHFLQGKLIDDI